MTVIGIDPGLGCTGWGVIEIVKGNPKYADSGSVRTSPEHSAGQRLEKLFSELQRVTREHDAEIGAVESGFIGHGPQTAMKLGQARAAAILALHTVGVPVKEISPREVKLAITGRGGAAKSQVSYMVGTMLGLQFDKGEDDVADALAVALCLALQQTRALRIPAR